MGCISWSWEGLSLRLLPLVAGPGSGTAFGAGDFWAVRGEGRRISQHGIIAVRGALKKSRFRFILDINYINDENDDGNSDTDESNALQ